jgi:hypothetical protein
MAAPAVIGSEPTAPRSAAVSPRRLVHRLRPAVPALGAAVLGAAPHVLHHAGPLAGAALLAGATGKLLFGALGFVLTVPMLRRLRRRTGSWRVSGGALAVMAVVFMFSSFVIGPTLAGSGEAEREAATPSQTVPAAPPGVSESEHESHHR